MAYLAADCKAAVLAERSGRDTPEDAMNRLALYVAHSLHAVTANPTTLRANDVRHPDHLSASPSPPGAGHTSGAQCTRTETFGLAQRTRAWHYVRNDANPHVLLLTLTALLAAAGSRGAATGRAYAAHRDARVEAERCVQAGPCGGGGAHCGRAIARGRHPVQCASPQTVANRDGGRRLLMLLL